jgi:dCTP deaminase
MILSDTEIKAALADGRLIIDPAPPTEHITTSAMDLRLGAEFKRWKPAPPGGFELVIDPANEDFRFENAAPFLEDLELEKDGSVILRPRDFLLAITEERIELPVESQIAARVEGRSTLARLGVGVHVTAPTIHLGFRGQITLEITHHGVLPIRLRPGLRICQLILEQTSGVPSRKMTGEFQDQRTVLGGAQPDAEAKQQ